MEGSQPMTDENDNPMEDARNGQLLLFSEYRDPKEKTRETRILLSHEHVVQALEFYMRAMGYWPYPNEVILDADLGIELNDEGLVEMDVVLVPEYAN